MEFNINDAIKKEMDEHGIGGGGNYYRIEEGNENVCRVLTVPATLVTYYDSQKKTFATAYGKDKGDPRGEGDERKGVRFILYVLDRKDGKVKLAELPYSVWREIGGLQVNPDFAFSEIPMPYDVRITYNKDESPSAMYKVTASANRESLTEEQTKELNEKMEKESPESIVAKNKEDQIAEDKKNGVWINPDF
jgi:hypothetical protein